MKTEKLKKGELITFVRKSYNYATVAEVKSVGSVNLHFFYRGENAPTWRGDAPEMIELEQIAFVVKGAHPKLGPLLQTARVEHDKVLRERDEGRRRGEHEAMRQFHEVWDAENPWPAPPDPQDALRRLNIVRQQITIG